MTHRGARRCPRPCLVLIDGAAHISKCAAPFCFGYLKLRYAFDEKGLMVRHDFEENNLMVRHVFEESNLMVQHDFEESNLMVRHGFEESDLMVRHTPAFGHPSPRGDGLPHHFDYQRSAAVPSPLGEGWPKAGVCRTIEQANGWVCRTVEPCTSTLHINSCCTAKTFSLIRT